MVERVMNDLPVLCRVGLRGTWEIDIWARARRNCYVLKFLCKQMGSLTVLVVVGQQHVLVVVLACVLPPLPQAVVLPPIQADDSLGAVVSEERVDGDDFVTGLGIPKAGAEVVVVAVESVQLLPVSEKGLDGFVSLEEKGFLFSSWGDSAVYWIRADFNVTVLVGDVEAPADIGYDMSRNRVLIPLFRANELRLREVR